MTSPPKKASQHICAARLFVTDSKANPSLSCVTIPDQWSPTRNTPFSRTCVRAYARERFFGCTGEKHLDCTDDIFGCTRIDYQVVSLADL